MSLNILRQSIEVEMLIGEDRSQLLVKADAPVQGVGQEAVEVLLEDARILLDSVEVQSDRVVLDGQVHCQALYRIGDDPKARPMTAIANFEHIANIPGAGARMSAQIETEVEHVEAQYENGRMTFYVSVLPKVRVVQLSTIEPISGLTGIEGLEQSFVELRSAKLNAEASAPVLLRDEVNLPVALNAEGVLMYWATPKVTSVARDLGGARVSGDVLVETLVASGVVGRPVALVRDSLVFEQLIELPDWLSGDVDATAEVRSLNVSLEPGGQERDSLLRLNCEMSLGARVNGEESASALADAYGTGQETVNVTREPTAFCLGVQRMNGQDMVKTTLMLPEGAPGVGTPLAVKVWPTVSEWTADSDSTTIQGVLETAVLYMPGGSDRLSSVRAETPFVMRCPGTLNEDGWLRVSASEAEASTLMSDRLELRCALKATGVSRLIEEVDVAMEAEATMAPAKRRGIIVNYPAQGDTLWSIAKRYAMPVSAIQEANGGLAEAPMGKALILKV